MGKFLSYSKVFLTSFTLFSVVKPEIVSFALDLLKYGVCVYVTSHAE